MGCEMQKNEHYQKDHLDAIHRFYDELNLKANNQFSLTEIVIAWFTEGYAESFRKDYLKTKNLVAS
jgi:hypothetical protein